MGVYIKGMEMPTCCAGCCLDRFCKHWDIVPYRHEDCPLVPVPTPHGRLIDADALNSSATDYSGNHLVYLVDIDDAPTIIPAEEEQT